MHSHTQTSQPSNHSSFSMHTPCTPIDTWISRSSYKADLTQDLLCIFSPELFYKCSSQDLAPYIYVFVGPQCNASSVSGSWALLTCSCNLIFLFFIFTSSSETHNYNLILSLWFQLFSCLFIYIHIFIDRKSATEEIFVFSFQFPSPHIVCPFLPTACFLPTCWHIGVGFTSYTEGVIYLGRHCFFMSDGRLPRSWL